MKEHYRVIMFDMDGTLVPMNMEEFTNGYFVELGKKLAPYRIEQSKLVKSIWAGTKSMVENDGTVYNRERFWNTFSKLTGIEDITDIDNSCIEFYGNEFNLAKKYTKDNTLAKKAIEIAREKSEKVILASNPLFPRIGQLTRMSWVGLKESDFDLITAYESDVYCKPNPNYYLDICKKIDADPSECLMIGNDENEDMYAASLAGIDGYLIEDCVIESKEHPFIGRRGSFEDLIKFLEALK